jgi:glycerol-3-phosphate dehydrogenase
MDIDLLVIGGGITGAGIALDAQSRGLQVALVEKQDFAAGTSSRSTKLIHGGLRYLKQLELSLVAEVGKERAIVYENAPHVTHPEWMVLPIIRGGTYGKWASSFGIWLYDRLAGVKKTERRQMLSYEETLQKVPLLRKEGLKGAGYYVEYRTDDARLTIEVLKKAYELGAKCFNYVEVTDLLYREGQLAGVRVVDHLNARVRRIWAKKIVNATGPWCDQLREKDGSKQGKTLHWTKGVHLVVDQKHFPLQQAVYFDTPDGRMVFAIPREEKVYIGTTDTDYHGELENPRVTVEDRDYLLRAVREMFPSVKIGPAEVESSWAGVRPLIHEEGKAPSEISRKDEMFVSKSGLITITGGKLTGYRKMAEKVVDFVMKELAVQRGSSFIPCQTEKMILSGGEVGGSSGWPAFVENQVTAGLKVGFSEEEARQLIRLFGSNVVQLFAYAKEEKKLDKVPLSLRVMVRYAVNHEMVATASDFFIRRTGALLFHRQWMELYKQDVLMLLQKHLEWSEQELDRQIKELDYQIEIATQAVGKKN